VFKIEKKDDLPGRLGGGGAALLVADIVLLPAASNAGCNLFVIILIYLLNCDFANYVSLFYYPPGHCNF
jgi:hypothetical protein